MLEWKADEAVLSVTIEERSPEPVELTLERRGIPKSFFSIFLKHGRFRRSVKDTQDTRLEQNSERGAKPALLLSLPSELRIQISRYVVVNEQRISVSKTDCTQPALLRTCRQIREECLKIFYGENHFDIYLYDLEYDLSTAHWCRNGVEGQHRHWHYRGLWKWSNLKNWLQRRHAEPLNLVSRPHNTDVDRHYRTVASLFNIVDTMKAHPWEEVEKVLEEVRFVSIAGHGKLLWTA